MASTTSSDTTNPPSAISNSNIIEFNLASNLPIKLCTTNYPTWHRQLMHLLKANNLEGYVTGAIPCPASTLGIGEFAVANPAYQLWCRQDNHVSLALLGSYSPKAQVIVASATSSADAWAKLQKAFSNRSRARVMSLKGRLAAITKGTSSVHDYLCSIRSIADELALINHPIDDIDLVIAALNGLGPSFREFSASIRTRDTPFSLMNCLTN